MPRETNVRSARVLRDTNVSRAPHRRNIALLALCGAMFLDSLDVSLIGVALPTIEQDLGLSRSTLQWLVSGYTVAYGGFLLLGGRTADLFGRRRVFLAAMAVFAAASLVGGLIEDGGLMVVTRVLKGVAAAFTAPAALSIITTTFREGTERNRALAVYSATAASGYSLGLVLSGFLTQLHWRLVFFFPVLIAIAVLVVGYTMVDRDEPGTGRNRKFDGAGALSVTAGLLLLVFGLVQISEVGLWHLESIGPLGLALALLVVFVLVEHRHQDPGVPLRIFRSATLSTANLLAVCFMAASIGWQFIATLYLQQLLGYGAMQTALALLPLGITVVVIAQFVTPRLLAQFGNRAVAITGMILQAAGILLFTQAALDVDYALLLLPAVVLHGAGNGLVFPTMNIAGVSGVENEEQGLASGLITASAQIGAGVGVAVLTGVSTAVTRGTDPLAQLGGFHAAFLVGGLLSLLGLVVALAGFGPYRARIN